MFLSQLSLNTRSGDVHRDLASPYEMHRTLMAAFPDKSAGGAGRVLYRIDIAPDEDRPPVVLVQSEFAPNWDCLQERQYASVTGPEAITYTATKVEATGSDAVVVAREDRYRFRLVANPTVKRKVDGKKNGRRDACGTEEQQLAWLIRKGEVGGFRLDMFETNDGREVPNVTVVPLGKISSFRKKDHRTLSHQGVRFDGVLLVTDANLFLKSLTSGIGSAKAFGFGLLSVARV
ncbi:MAG: type I-E CRISPR-associated protein Cas6/Cse3/CasE [Planctomycetaceae bacterium]